MMIRIVYCLILFVSINSCSAEPPSNGRVTRVIDGDTIVIAPGKGKKTVTCRLYGIDAPETGRKDRKGQPFAEEAGQELSKLVLGQSVEFTTTGEITHKREVCLIRNNGMDINLEMVKRGYSWAYRRHLKSPYASEYINAEREARLQRSGIWKQANPLPPWEFKKKYWFKQRH